MPPFVALLLWFVALVWFLRNDPAKPDEVSPALWVPFAWMTFVGSRSPSQWYGRTDVSIAQALEEGHPLDRVVFFALIVAACAILVARRRNWQGLLSSNRALMLFVLFALLSVTWSDFPGVALRRWIRHFGDYLMVLVVLSDPRPLHAISTLVRRLSFLLISLSVLLIKYYRQLAVTYYAWSGSPDYAGVTTTKNMLGALCLVSGLFFFWDTVSRWPARKMRKTKKILFVNGVLMAMTLWLLHLTDSATSRSCLAMGCLIILVLQSSWGKAHFTRLAAMIPIAVIGCLLFASVFDVSAMIAQLTGRDPTLTGRTDIWTVLLNQNINPLLGAGYESFWLGDRLVAVWTGLGIFGLNEAHNGYLETYLNLGLLGLGLLGGFLIASYLTIRRRLPVSPHFAALSLSLWTIFLIYNVTEAAFKSSFLWCTFLLCSIAVPWSFADPPSGRPTEVVKSNATV